MRTSAPFVAMMLTVLACSGGGGSTVVISPAPSETVVPPTPAETAAPPTPVPPSPTPLPPVIDTGNVGRLAVFRFFGDGELVRSLAFSPDGTALAAAVSDPAASIGTIRLFDTVSGRPMRTLEGHTLAVWGLTISPDGRFLASAGRDHSAKIWDWRDGSLVQSLDFPNEVVAVTFSPDSRTLAVGGVAEPPGGPLQDATIWTYAVDTWEPGLEFAEFWNIPAIAYSPDGEKIVGGGTSPRGLHGWLSPPMGRW